MVFGVALLLSINLAYVQLLIHPDNGCDFAERLSSKQASSFKNPHWPATYAPGTTCRWTFDCPIWYACRLRCLDVGLPQTDDCYMDKLLVSGSGNPQLEGAQVFCGRTEINFRSVGSRLTLALVTNRLSPGGRFRCTIRSEPWTQPWFMSPCTPNPMLANRNGISHEEEEVSQKQKIITSANTNHRRLSSDLPHTGLVQSRKPHTAPELERNPHIKNDPEPYANHVKANSSYVKFIKADSFNAKRPRAKLLIGNAESDVLYADSIQAGSPYLDNFEDGSPRLQNPEPRSRPVGHTLSESSPVYLDQSVQGLTEYSEPKISHVRHIKAESQYGKSSKLRLKSQLPYLDNVEYATPHTTYGRGKSIYVRYIQSETSPADLDLDEHGHTENLEEKNSHARHKKVGSQRGKTKLHLKSRLQYLDNVEDTTPHTAYGQKRFPYVRHRQAESPPTDSADLHTKIDTLYPDNLDVNSLPYINDAESSVVHIRRAKAAYPHYKSFQPHKKLDSYVESVEVESSHTKNKLVKNPYLKLVNSSPPESFQTLRTFHHVLDLPPHIQKSNTPRLRRVKSGLPYANNFNPDQKVNIPYLDNVQDGIETVEAEPVRIKPLKGLPYNERTPQEEPRRKHKVVSHVKRTQQGKHRGFKQKYVHEASRRVRHEIIRTPSKANQLPAGLPRITHQRTGLPHSRRVRTHLKRVTPYKGDKSTRFEKKQSYF
ncbi:unnamed protein product [Arctia plantaginis]|uniref:CUB domain-containing protein n=1 Tax=Arctia plantaginis TaxID=874455 RepID=A0A8S1BBR3_ARCPL|nr:unnamed protein product [Arctia plantaginis]